MFRGEQTFPAARIARFFEESRRVEVGEQIRSGLLIEFAGLIFPVRIDAHIVGAWFHMVAASEAGVQSRSIRRPRSGATVPPLPLML